MAFNSLRFILFFSAFFVLYTWVLSRLRVKWRNLGILLASYLFYASWDWRFLSLIIISSLTDYLVGQRLGKIQNPKRRKGLLLISLCVNLGMLGVFKYFNFFRDSLVVLLAYTPFQPSIPTLDLILPVGISFYTFQTLSYTIDIYRKRIQPTSSVLTFFTFVAFFPQLVAGPIERASHLLPQFERKSILSYQQSVQGMRIILLGFFKKIVIADNFGLLADYLLNPALPQNGWLTLTGSFSFCLQIYGDFSGYSDIAIGLAMMMGFRLNQNFDTPYFSRSLTEFWRRWHISLSTWFRDYLYIPLGGNRKGKFRTYYNLFLTFLLSGLWHGADWTFVIWGALHGILIVVERILPSFKRKAIWILPVFITVWFLWIPFRAEGIHHYFHMLAGLFNLASYDLTGMAFVSELYPIRKVMALSIISLLYFSWEGFAKGNDLGLSKLATIPRRMVYFLLAIIIFLFINFESQVPFIYFQF